MKTLDLIEAAALLKMSPEVLRRKAAAGTIPGVKPSRRWCFKEEDLAEYLHSLYSNTAKTSWGVDMIIRKQKTWHSTKEVTFGGLGLNIKGQGYKKALGLLTK